MNSPSGIVLGRDDDTFSFSRSSYRTPSKTSNDIPLSPTTFSGLSDEGVPLLDEPKGNSPIPLSINLPPPPMVNTPINTIPSETSFITPRPDVVSMDENQKKYKYRHRIGLELVMVYDVIVSVLFVVAYLRYRKDNFFWTIFFISIVWDLFGTFAIWYGTVNGDITVGIILTIVFPLLLFAYGAVSLEPRHRLYDKYSHLKSSS